MQGTVLSGICEFFSSRLIYFTTCTLFTGIMELSNHPKMTWRGRRNWPPSWNGPHGPYSPLPQGKVGILTRVATTLTNSHCVLVIRHNDQEYYGTLVFD